MKVNNEMGKYFVPEFPNKIQIGVQDGYCNLRCPMCLLHSSKNKRDLNTLKGKMPLENLCKILDEVKETKLAIIPHKWSEPLMISYFSKCIEAIKNRGMAVIINTNGLLLTKKLARFLVDIELDSITFSIDAVTKETLKKIRGYDALDKVNSIVLLMLNTRGNLAFPRIGVSMALGEANKHEKDEFISYWIKYVDVVRVNKMYTPDMKVKDLVVPEQRVPCELIYNNMIIDYKGDVSMCCLDVLSKTNMGNVFRDGVKNIWHGKPFSELRYYHETGQYDKIPLCKNCGQWANYKFEESVIDGVLIRKSPIMTFYNRLDKLTSWKSK